MREGRKKRRGNERRHDTHSPRLASSLPDQSRTGDLDDVTGHDLAGSDHLHTSLVGADDLAHLGLVLLQRLDGTLGVPLLGTQRHGER